ncbi:MAG TPA: MFS transporter [Gaiellales bacterium]
MSDAWNLGVLRERQFALFFWGQAVSVLGDGIFPIALAFAVLELGGSPTALGLVFTAGILPQAVFVLIGGVWADRLPRRTIMLVSDAARAVIQATTAVLLLSGHAQVWHLVVLYALNATAQAFFMPAATALVPQVTPQGQLQAANALLGITRSLAFGAGAALGGVFVSLVSTGGAVALDACTFLVSAACLWGVSGARAAAGDAASSFLAELRDGFAEVRRHRWLWVGLLNAFLFVMIVVAPFEIIGPVISRSALGGAFAWGVILTGFSVGTLLGGLVMLRIRLERPMFVAGILFFATCFAPLLLALPAPVWSITLAYAGEGFAVGIFVTTWETALQHHIPADKLARVGAWDWLGTIGGMPLGYALTGPIVGAVGSSATLVGVAVSAFALSLVFVLNRDLRELRIDASPMVKEIGVPGA